MEEAEEIEFRGLHTEAHKDTSESLERAGPRSNMGLDTHEKKNKDHIAVSNANGNGSQAGCTAGPGEVVDKAYDGHRERRGEKRPIRVERVKEDFHLAKEVSVCRGCLLSPPATSS